MAIEEPTRILLVEDDEEDYLITRGLLGEIQTWRVKLEWVSSFEAGLEQIEGRRHDVCLIDYRLGARDGLELLRSATERGCGAPMILLTGLDDHEIDMAAMKAGAADYLCKARIDAELLERSIRYALEHHRAQVMLAEANEQLQKKNKILSELTETAHRFVDNVAHEFRTPLTVIKEFASIIAEGLGGPVTQEQAQYLEFISSATRDLAQMVTDFLDSSKLKAGSLRVDRQAWGVERLFESVRVMLSARAAEKRIRVVEEVEPGLGLVFADLEKAGRVVINLAVNAIKFSPEGSVVRLWAKGSAAGGVEVGVTDQGSGLSEQDVGIIFRRFKQVGDVQRASTKGFGLGLNIAKELIWLNLGMVRVESRPAAGSTFSFTLPPDDPAVVLRGYFERLAELDEPPTQLAVVRVEQGEGWVETSRLWGFLASVVYPMDLIFPAEDRRGLILIGATAEPQRWVEHLVEANRSRQQNKPTQTWPDLKVTCLGQWAYPGEYKGVEASVLAHVSAQRMGHEVVAAAGGGR